MTQWEASAVQDVGLGKTRAWWALAVVTLVYAVNIADRFVLSTLIEPIKAEFQLSDASVGFLTGVALAIFYTAAGLPLGALADRVNRRNMIMAALTVWSLFTALCGFAQTFWHLLIARIGVGVGEAGGTPPSHSILADYFKPAHRIVAMSVFSLGVALGSGIGGIGGGLLAERLGWRHGLIVFAFASLPILLLLLTVREPRRGACDVAPTGQTLAAKDMPGLRAALGFIRSQRALIHVLAGATVATFSGMGLIWWTPAFLSRSHGFSVGEAGIEVGMMSGLGGGAALVAATLFTFKLARMEARWQCHFLAGVTLLITVPGVLAHVVADRNTALLLLWCFIPFANVYIGPTLALLQNLVRPDMRGISVAVLLFTANIANLAIAPQFIGLASDLIAARIAQPQQSLSIALALSGLTGIWAAAHFWAAIRSLPGDLVRAGTA